MQIQHLHGKSSLSEDLALIEAKNLKNIDKFYATLNKMADTKTYEEELRKQNYLWSQAFFDNATTKQKYAHVNTDSTSFRFGFYVGLMIASKTARKKVFDQAFEMQIPPKQEKLRFFNALTNEERRGRVPFTPQSAALMETALTVHTYKEIQKHPEDSVRLQDKYHTAVNNIYKLAEHDGCQIQDVAKQSRDLTHYLVQERPELADCFQDLAFGRVERTPNSYDQNGNLVTEGDYIKTELDGSQKPMKYGFDVRVPLNSDQAVDKLVSLTVDNLGSAISSSDLKDTKAFAENYQNQVKMVAKEAVHDNAMSEKDVQRNAMALPISGANEALRSSVYKKYGDETGDKLMSSAIEFTKHSLTADTNSKDYKRRLYNYARDNKIDGVKLQDQIGLIKCFNKGSQVALSINETDPNAVKKLIDITGNDYQKQVLDKSAINDEWNKQTVNPLTHETQDALDKQNVINSSISATNSATQAAMDIVKQKLGYDDNKLRIVKSNEQAIPNSDRISGVQAVKLVDNLVNKYGIDGLALAYDVSKKHSKEIDQNTDNRGQYLDINFKNQNAFKKQLQSLYKQDKFKSVDAAIDTYAQTLMKQNPEYEVYLKNSGLSAQELEASMKIDEVQKDLKSQPKLTIIDAPKENHNLDKGDDFSV